jgi:ComF family protein
MRPWGDTVLCPPLEAVETLFEYEGRAAQAVRRLKYERATSLISWMGTALAERYRTAGLERYDLVVPIPIHPTRRRERGFNQAEVLAEDLPRVNAVLARVGVRSPQAGRSRQDRLRDWDGVFRVLEPLGGRSVLLVDDVMTTGSSLRAAAEVLKAAGASEVGALVFAYEP